MPGSVDAEELERKVEEFLPKLQNLFAGESSTVATVACLEFVLGIEKLTKGSTKAAAESIIETMRRVG